MKLLENIDVRIKERLRSMAGRDFSDLQDGPDQGAFEEQMRALLVSVLNLIDQRGNAIIAVTGATRGEGASTVAAGLAELASKQEWCRVVLVDGARSGVIPIADAAVSDASDLASPRDGAMLPIAQDQNRLVRVPLSVQASPLHSIDSLRKFYDFLRGQVTLVIIDCPPVMEANETPSLAAMADGVILVIEADHTRIPVLRRSCAKLEKAGARVIGTVLNKREQLIPSWIYRHI